MSLCQSHHWESLLSQISLQISYFFTHMTNYWTVFAIGLQQFAGVVLHKLGRKPGKEGTCHSSSLGWKCKFEPKRLLPKSVIWEIWEQRLGRVSCEFVSNILTEGWKPRQPFPNHLWCLVFLVLPTECLLLLWPHILYQRWSSWRCYHPLSKV